MVSKNYPYYAALAILCCLGSAFRLYNIQASFWCDEMMQATAAAAPWKDLFYLTANHSSPPLDYVVMKVFMLCFGKSDWVLRMPAFLFGIAAIPVFYFFSCSLAGRKTALTAAALLTFSPLAIGYSQEARMYSLFLLLSLISITAAARLAHKNSFACSILLGAANGLLILTHYFGIFIIAGETIFLLSEALRGSKKSRVLELLAVSLIIAFFLFLPWLPFFLVQVGKQIEISHGMSATIGFFKVFLFRFATDKYYADFWAYAYAGIFLAGLAAALRKKESAIVYSALSLLAFVVLFFGIAMVKKVVTVQNAIFLLPSFLLVCAYGITSMFDFLRIRFWLSLAVIILVAAWPAALYLGDGAKGHRQPWKDASEYIEQHSDGTEKILIIDPLDRGCLAYYADPEASYAVMKKDWKVFMNDPSWKIWVIDDDLFRQLKEKRFSGWIVSPSFVLDKAYNDYFFKNFRVLLNQLLGPPVKEFSNQWGPLQLFHVRAAHP